MVLNQVVQTVKVVHNIQIAISVAEAFFCKRIEHKCIIFETYQKYAKCNKLSFQLQQPVTNRSHHRISPGDVGGG